MSEEFKSFWRQRDNVKWALQILVLPATGWIISQVAGNIISQAQERDNDRRVYADMMSRREQAESALRKDMFQTILQPVLSQKTDQLNQNVLRLEMLAHNFHDSLDVGPLFKDVHRQLTPRSDEESSQLCKRLEDAARAVITKQIDLLREAGAVRPCTVFVKKIPAEGVIVIDGEELRLQTTDQQPRLFRVEVLAFNAGRKELRIQIEVFKGKPPVRELFTGPFWIGPFDFPLIDNTRLSGGQRAAVALTRPAEGSTTEIALVYFPGSRASLKDRQYYDEMTGEILNMTEQLEKRRRTK